VAAFSLPKKTLNPQNFLPSGPICSDAKIRCGAGGGRSRIPDSSGKTPVLTTKPSCKAGLGFRSTGEVSWRVVRNFDRLAMPGFATSRAMARWVCLPGYWSKTDSVWFFFCSSPVFGKYLLHSVFTPWGGFPAGILLWTAFRLARTVRIELDISCFNCACFAASDYEYVINYNQVHRFFAGVRTAASQRTSNDFYADQLRKLSLSTRV